MKNKVRLQSRASESKKMKSLQLSKDDLRKLIAQARAIAEFRPSTDESEAKHKAATDLFESLIGELVQKKNACSEAPKEKLISST
jgi:septal ring factor EnvC (AmiA/AmiB activator)